MTPRHSNIIILFVTEEKQPSFTQYQDYFEGDVLYMEGERNHANDNRLINADRNGDQVFLFYRKRHHRLFTFAGQVELVDYQQTAVDEPSRFVFRTQRIEGLATSSLLTEELTHGLVDEAFVPDLEGRRRLQRHITYERSRRNRARAIAIHGTICKVCGFNFNTVYGEELARDYIEIHHIRPLAEQGETTVAPEHDLIPLCSNCHSMVHRRRGDVMPITELQALLTKQRSK